MAGKPSKAARAAKRATDPEVQKRRTTAEQERQIALQKKAQSPDKIAQRQEKIGAMIRSAEAHGRGTR